MAVLCLDQGIQAPALPGVESVESFENPQDAMPAQAGENPAFYHLPRVRPMDRLHVACCSFHSLYTLAVASRHRFVKVNPYAFGRSVSLTGIRKKADPDIKFVSESTVRIILRATRIDLLRYAYCPTPAALHSSIILIAEPDWGIGN